MPTGYTEKIADGITPRSFILRCARAFGPCARMREESMDLLLPKKLEPQDYHKKKIEECEKELGKIENISDEEAEKMAEDDYNNAVLGEEKYIKDKRELKIKYENMRNEIKKWQPPTPDHINLRDFMIEQIKISIDGDCNTEYSEERLKNYKKLSGKEWKKSQINRIKKDIKYHTDNYKEEVNNIDWANAWLKALYDSLPEGE